MKKLAIVEKFKNTSLYKKSLIIFTTCLCVVSLGFILYVYNSLVDYDNNLIEHYMSQYLQSKEVSELIENEEFIINEYENSNATLTDGLKELFKNDHVKFKKDGKLSTEDTFVYDVIVNNQSLFKLSLISKESYTKMAILKIDKWDVTNMEMNLEKGFYHYDITLPKNYQLFVNDQLVDSKYITKEADVSGLDRVTEIVEINKTKTYQLDHFIYEPTIKIVDENNQEVEYEMESNTILVNPLNFKEVSTYEEAKQYLKTDIDVLELARNWSLILTDDLGGPAHGFYQLTPYLIEGTYMYDMAFGWTHNVDITFVSQHTLKNPAFTNQKLSNFVIYNENAFSCEVYLEKNMRLFYGDKQDIMHDRLYFVYHDGAYKLVDMKAIVEE